MSYRPLRSTTLKSSFAQLDDFLLNQPLPEIGESLILHEIERHYHWLQCIKIDHKQKSNNSEKDVKNSRTNPNGMKSIGTMGGITLGKKKRKKEEEESDFEFELNSLYEPTDSEEEKSKKDGAIDNVSASDNDFDSPFSIDEDRPIASFQNRNRMKSNKLKNEIISHKQSKKKRLSILDLFDKDRKEKQKKKKIWLLSGLYAPDTILDMPKSIPSGQEFLDINEDQDKFNEEDDEPLKHNLKFKVPENNILKKDQDFKMPWNIFCPGTLDKAIHIDDVKDIFVSINDNAYEEKLQSQIISIDGGHPLQLDQEVLEKYKHFKTLQEKQSAYIIHGVEIFDTDIKGYGLRTVRDYEPHSLITEYTGEILTYKEFNNLQHSKDYAISFVDGYVIDAFKRGSVARFINHSVNPNSYIKTFFTKAGKPKLGVFANENGINPGEEITFDYNTNKIYNIKPQRCFCGETKCKGFIRTFYKKLVLINMLEFNDYYNNSNNISADHGNITEMTKYIQSTVETQFPIKRLKGLSIYCSVSTEQDRQESYFYVVGKTQEYQRETSIAYEGGRPTSIDYGYAEEEEEEADETDSTINGGGSEGDGRSSIAKGTSGSGASHASRQSAAKRNDLRTKKLRRKTLAGERRRNNYYASKIRRERSTNGSAEFNHLPDKLKRQLGIDMVVNNL